MPIRQEMACIPLNRFVVLAFVLLRASEAIAAGNVQNRMIELIAVKDQLEMALKAATGKKPPAVPEKLIEVNREIAELARAQLEAQGYGVGPVTAVKAGGHVFTVEVLQGPSGSPVGRVVNRVGQRFGIGFQVKVGDLHFGSYAHESRKVNLAPNITLLPEKEIYNTILHEVRHGYHYSKLAKGINDPWNMSISVANDKFDVSNIEIYEKYMNFQEVATHEHDFHLSMAGVPSTYELENMAPEQVAIMKAEKTVQMAEKIDEYTALARKTLEQEGALIIDKNSDDVPYVIIPLKDPKTQEHAWDLKVYLPKLKPNAAPEEMRKEALELLAATNKSAKAARVRVGKELKEFQANPIVKHSPLYPRTECEGMYKFIGQ